MNACTDGLLSGKPHPRVYGTFPRIFRKYVHEEKTLKLEKAIYEMTKKPADTFHIAKRCQLKAGYYADITIFDKDTIIDKGTFTNPVQYPEGIHYVFVNGQMIIENKKHTGIRFGKVLRKQGN